MAERPSEPFFAPRDLEELHSSMNNLPKANRELNDSMDSLQIRHPPCFESENQVVDENNPASQNRKQGKAKRFFKSLKKFGRSRRNSVPDMDKLKGNPSQNGTDVVKRKCATLPTKRNGENSSSDNSSASLSRKFKQMFKLSSRDSVIDDSPTSDCEEDDHDELKRRGMNGIEDSGVDVSSHPNRVVASRRYSGKDVREALGPSMRDVGKYFNPVAFPRHKTVGCQSSISEDEEEKISSRPPLPLPPEAKLTEPTSWHSTSNSRTGALDEDVLYEKVTNAFDRTRLKMLQRGLADLLHQGWYWGPITRIQAEERLDGLPNGAFLVRDSADGRYMLSLSFRSEGRTLHSRIEYSNGFFSFYTFPDSENDGYQTVLDLIEHAMEFSQDSIFCFSRARNDRAPTIPVRLTQPVSRFTKVRSLQDQCRFVIRQYTRFDQLNKLPVPKNLREYLECSPYLADFQLN